MPPDAGSWWSDHPDLEGLARRGRNEFRDETVAAEHDAELLRKRRRSIVDVCHEWMSRGDLITVAAAGHQFEGRLVAVVNDLLVVDTRNFEVAVNIAGTDFVRSDRRARFDGTTGDRTVSSFRAALGRSEIDGSPVHLVGIGAAFDVTGTIEAATDDHILVQDKQGIQWALLRARVAFAIRGS